MNKFEPDTFETTAPIDKYPVEWIFKVDAKVMWSDDGAAEPKEREGVVVGVHNDSGQYKYDIKLIDKADEIKKNVDPSCVHAKHGGGATRENGAKMTYHYPLYSIKKVCRCVPDESGVEWRRGGVAVVEVTVDGVAIAC